MFSSQPAYAKLKTNLRLSINRQELKLLEKKKTELALKSRKEIADYLAQGKPERAKIRVEHIIREDYLVEAMELIEMFCDLMLARFGLIQQMKTLDEGLAEAISSVIWAAPRLQGDVQELRVISDQLAVKYGKPYVMSCRENALGTVSEKLMHKLGVQAPPKVTVEKYLIEIAKYYNVDYLPDPQVHQSKPNLPIVIETMLKVMAQDEVFAAEALIDLAPDPVNSNINSNNNNNGAGGGFVAPNVPFEYPSSKAVEAGVDNSQAGQLPTYAPYPPYAPFNNNMGNNDGPPPYFPPGGQPGQGATYTAPASTITPATTNPAAGANAGAAGSSSAPPPLSNSSKDAKKKVSRDDDMPELPGVPSDMPALDDDDDDGEDAKEEQDKKDNIDFDDLAKRFEKLKKKK